MSRLIAVDEEYLEQLELRVIGLPGPLTPADYRLLDSIRYWQGIRSGRAPLNGPYVQVQQQVDLVMQQASTALRQLQELSDQYAPATRPDPAVELGAEVLAEAATDAGVSMQHCARCGSPLTESGRCEDITCPFHDHAQTCPMGWYGHPSHPGRLKCNCRAPIDASTSA